jgi:Spy/CpxP family protein refolding chaperone
MKKLLIIALAFFTLNGMAQKREHKADRKQGFELRKQMTPADIADLKAKKLTLKLDLTDAQQQKVRKIILKQSEKNQKLRKEQKAAGEKREKPTKDEFVKMQNHKLDQLIEFKRELKTILTPEQYEKFETMQPKTDGKKARKTRGKA